MNAKKLARLRRQVLAQVEELKKAALDSQRLWQSAAEGARRIQERLPTLPVRVH